MYRNVDFTTHGLEYERHYRLATIEMFRFFKEKRGRYRRKTKWWMEHEKAKPGLYRRPRRLRNAYVIYHED